MEMPILVGGWLEVHLLIRAASLLFWWWVVGNCHITATRFFL